MVVVVCAVRRPGIVVLLWLCLLILCLLLKVARLLRIELSHWLFVSAVSLVQQWCRRRDRWHRRGVHMVRLGVAFSNWIEVDVYPFAGLDSGPRRFLVHRFALVGHPELVRDICQSYHKEHHHEGAQCCNPAKDSEGSMCGHSHLALPYVARPTVDGTPVARALCLDRHRESASVACDGPHRR